MTEHERVVGAVLACGPAAVLAGASAAIRSGLRGWTEPAVHVLIPAGLHPRCPDGVVLHRSSVLTPADIVEGRPPMTRRARSIVDGAQWARSDEAARTLIFMAFQQAYITEDQIAVTLERLPRARRRALIAEAAADAGSGVHSLPEAELGRLLRQAGLPLPDRQVPRRDTTGRQRFLDAYYDAWKLHIEVDGAQHMNANQWWADMERQNALWISGDRVLRFPAWTIRHNPDAVLSQIRAALLAAGWLP